MKFIHMHEALRQKTLGQINDGALSVTLIARKTGLAQAHISNFLREKRRLSPNAMDRVLGALAIGAEGLLPSSARRGPASIEEEMSSVPVVSHSSALSDPVIYPSAVIETMPLPSGLLQSLRTRKATNRSAWQRFIAVRISPEDALPMEPLILPKAFVVIDRHYNSPVPYRLGRPSLCAVRRGAHLILRYVEPLDDKLALRPLNLAFPVELLQSEPGKRVQELVAGRVVLVLNRT
jgi:hypothetical protein